MSSYYNDNDPFCCAWLRNLIDAGHIAPGDVDQRDIRDVTPGDIEGYTQCHFFAGIGGWSYALRLAGWPDDRPVWTGSCPCQPFSSAGQRKGTDDERHLWPALRARIDELRPAVVFGEQVGGALGFEWLARVFDDLEAMQYRTAGADLPACCVGAPHIRQRLWWVSDAGSGRVRDGGRGAVEGAARGSEGEGDQRQRLRADAASVGHAESSGGLAVTEAAAEQRGAVMGNGLGNADESRSQRRRVNAGEHAGERDTRAAGTYIQCADGKARRIEPGIQPLAYGIPGRVGRLRAYGNAIVPQVAAEFIGAFMDCPAYHCPQPPEAV